MSIPTRADIQKRVASLIDGKKISRQAIEEMALDIARSAYRAGRRSAMRAEPSKAYPPSDIEAIQWRVAEHYGLSIEDMTTSHRKWLKVARPRQVAMYIASKTAAASLTAIGRKFGNRDHITVAAAIARIQAMCDADASFRDEVEGLACERLRLAA